MSNKENGSTPGSGGGGSSTNQSNASGGSSEAHQYVGPYRLEKTLGKGQTGKNGLSKNFNQGRYIREDRNNNVRIHSFPF